MLELRSSPTAAALVAAGSRRLRRDADRFSRRGDEELQARELLEHAAGRELDDDDEVGQQAVRRFSQLLERRARGEPVPYIRGYEEFGGLRFSVGPGAFVPRQSTEFLARQAVRRLRGRRAPIAADLATGVGAVAVVIAHEVPAATVYGTDIAPAALRLARANARANGVLNVRFMAGSLFHPLPPQLRGSFDVVASHPPYVPTSEVGDLPAEVAVFEPIDSLTDDSDDGLGLVRVLVSEARDWLKPGGWLCVEVASDAARSLRSMMSRAGYRDTQSTRGSPYSRVLVGRR